MYFFSEDLKYFITIMLYLGWDPC